MPRNWGLCQVPMPPRMTDNSEMRPAARGERASLHTTHAAPNPLFERGLPHTPVLRTTPLSRGDSDR